MARNKEILQRVLSGEQYQDIVATLGLKKAGMGDDPEGPLEVPEWAKMAKKHLEGVSDRAWWQDLVVAWFEFEKTLKFPDGQVRLIVVFFSCALLIFLFAGSVQLAVPEGAPRGGEVLDRPWPQVRQASSDQVPLCLCGPVSEVVGTPPAQRAPRPGEPVAALEDGTRGFGQLVRHQARRVQRAVHGPYVPVVVVRSARH